MATRPQQVRLKPPRGAGPRRTVVRDRSALPSDLAASVAALADRHAVLVLVLDVDGFRQFNGDHGFAAGDAFLAEVGRRLARTPAGRAYAMGADAFALLLEGEPEDLWRRAAAALWATDPTGGGPALRCSFGAAVIAERGADAGRAISLAEDRLADQQNRSPSLAERYAELLLLIQRSRQPRRPTVRRTSRCWRPGSRAGWASTRPNVASCGAPPSSMMSASSPSTTPSSPSAGRWTTPSGR